ncbi:MAG TPA: cation:proton antiporter, partial [Gemmatimonadales bacterium]|nr:cation:proton antiporter [Gemmatimonadales bacterium]
MDVARFFLVLAAVLGAAKLFGEVAERIGQPAVLGELLAGVLLGGSVLGIVPSEGPGAEFIHVLAELGVLLLLFEIGLETDLREMFRVGPAALGVALVGVTLPFAL